MVVLVVGIDPPLLAFFALLIHQECHLLTGHRIIREPRSQRERADLMRGQKPGPRHHLDAVGKTLAAGNRGMIERAGFAGYAPSLLGPRFDRDYAIGNPDVQFDRWRAGAAMTDPKSCIE